MPVPAPATAEILKEVPVYGGSFDFEVTTPTGAAVIKALCSKYGQLPQMQIEKIGLGSGSKINKGIPNMLRLYYGTGLEKSKPDIESEKLIHISSNIDDCQPEMIGAFMEKLSESGALDWWAENIYMKKNRPAFKICALIRPEDMEKIINLYFNETTTFGVRTYQVDKYYLNWEIKEVKTKAGNVKVKIGYLGGKPKTISPEYESCKEISLKSGEPIIEIYMQALEAGRNK